MKVNKSVNVTKRDLKEYQLNRHYQLYTSRIFRDSPRQYGRTRDKGVQYNYRRDNVICTCRHSGLKRHHEIRYYSGRPKHIYAYKHVSRSYTDIGPTPLQCRKVKRVYLPQTDDRGVGSSDLSSYCGRRTRRYRANSNYDHKRTSSKCVGGMIDAITSILSEKLSPIIQTKSGGTSPKVSVAIELRSNTENGNKAGGKMLVGTSTQANDGIVKDNCIIDIVNEVRTADYSVEDDERITKSLENKPQEIVNVHTETREKRISKMAQEAERVFSSDSLVQHVHNLENPSEDKQSPIAIDPMENKLEREYRKMFCTKSRDSKERKVEEESNLKSASLLRRRFEALRRGINKKQESKRNAALVKNESSNGNQPSRRDVSIVSDPPSLEGRSYSSTKVYTPYSKLHKKTYGREKEWVQTEYQDSDYQTAEGMFKLWGKKFNLEDNACNSPKISPDSSRQPTEGEDKLIISDNVTKKDGKKFSFFKKKCKEKPIPHFKQKKGVTTTGRCEVRDGLTIKIGAANTAPRPPEQNLRTLEQIPKVYSGILRKLWLQQFLSRTIESRHSVKIRWNNKAYGTSSSTIFEIMENVYKDTGVVFRSRSEFSVTEESSYNKSFAKQRVNFVQDVQAWMIPTFIPDTLRPKPDINKKHYSINDNIQVRLSNHKWYIDKSKAFADKIQVILHSRNVLKYLTRPSSSNEYLSIDIPKGFFTDSSIDSYGVMHTSNEEVYNIVEYESRSQFTRNKSTDARCGLNDLKITVSTKDSCGLESKIFETVINTHRDMIIQTSNVNIPKRCNVTGVGVTPQKDINGRKQTIKYREEYSDDYEPCTQRNFKNKCADKYLQDYYRQSIPYPIDLWRASDSLMHGHSENVESFYNQGDIAKSCPNIYDDYHTSVISSCGASCSLEDKTPGMMTKFCCMFKTKLKSEPTYQSAEKRVLPKDSVEVSKRRKLYAQSNKSNWLTNNDGPPVKNNESKDTLIDCSKTKKACCKFAEKAKPKTSTKHVSLPDCDALNDSLVKQLNSNPSGILAFKSISKCDFCNNNESVCPRHTVIIPIPTCAIEPPRYPCLEPPPHPPCTQPPQSPCCTEPRPSCMQEQPPFMTQQRLPETISPPPCMLTSQKPPSKQPSPVRLPCMKPTRPTCMQSPRQSPCTIKKDQRKTSLSSSNTCKKSTRQVCSSPASSRDSSPTTSDISLSSPPCHMPPTRKPLKRKRNKCVSPGKPPCGSIPVSGIHMRSPPRSPCSTPPKAVPDSPPCSSSASSSSSTSKKSSLGCLNPPPCPRHPNCVSKPSSPNKKKSSSRTQTPVLRKNIPSHSRPPCKEPTPCKSGPCSSKSHCASTQISKSSRSLSDFMPCLKKLSDTMKSLKNRTTAKNSCSKCCQSTTSNIPTPRKRSPLCSSQKCTIKSPPQNKSSPRTPPGSLSPQSSSSSRESNKRIPSQSPDNPSNPKINKPSCKACRKTSNREFPWPLKNQNSNQPSLTSLCPGSPNSNPKESKNKKICPFDKPVRCPSPTKCSSPQRISGIFLKMRPLKKPSSKECLSENAEEIAGCPVEDKSSEESFTINIRKGTASTEEIREGMNIKVQDADGNTLYERKDYVSSPTRNKATTNTKQRKLPSVLNDMYKNSHVHVVSTNMCEDTEGVDQSNTLIKESKSDGSIANQIEIKFRLKITQGDKTAAINMGTKTSDANNDIGQTSKEVFLLKDETREKQCTEARGDKNDINIEIVIKNFKPKRDKKEYGEEFSQNISEKFQTVSTGYSDILPEKNADNAVFSIHRATVNQSCSNEASKTDMAESEECIERVLANLTVISESCTEKPVTDKLESKLPIKRTNSNVVDVQDCTIHTEKAPNYSSVTYTDEKDDQYQNTSDKPHHTDGVDLITEALTRDEKTSLLKKVFEKASKLIKFRNRDKSYVNDMLKIIFTDSEQEKGAPSNDVIKEITCKSLKSNYFTDTDSMNNYYQVDSSDVPSGQDSDEEINIRHTTEDVSERADKGSFEKSEKKLTGCLCSALATKLNMPLASGGCCCNKLRKYDKETNCDLKNEDLLLNYNAVEYVDVETQNSQYCKGTHLKMPNIRVAVPHSNHIDPIKLKHNMIAEHDTSKIRLQQCSTQEKRETKELDKAIMLGISNEDTIYVMNANSARRMMVKESSGKKVSTVRHRVKTTADILQSYETKRAVLEIYAQRTVEINGGGLVAKLPKLFCDDDNSDIERLTRNMYRNVRNDVLMSVKR